MPKSRTPFLLLLGALSASCAVLTDFQVAQPPSVPKGATQCTIPLIQRTFANSFGDPETVLFTPPTDCGAVGSWAGITFNLTVTSNGTQFDRLGAFTFKNVEIWRTSTPEPTPDGIMWSYSKDLTRYIPLFSSPGNLTFELDNLIETGLNGEYATVVTATFFASSNSVPAAPKADLIIPLSTLAPDSDDLISVQPAFSLNVTFPRNMVQAFVELYASGNGDEEFWYFNAVNEFLADLPTGITFGDGPFREVQLLVDGRLAGIALPYPVIFTGGINPAVWQPITSYGALDLPTYFVDLTPFIGVLSDGLPHNITLNVVSAEMNQAINANWFLTGSVQVVTGNSSEPTQGNITVYDVPPFATAEASVNIAGENVTITLETSHSLTIEADIVSGDGLATHVVWSQNLTFSNVQSYLNNAQIQNVVQTSQGVSASIHNGTMVLLDGFSFPLAINLTGDNPEFSSFQSTFDHSYNRDLLPSPFILQTNIANTQTANGTFSETSSGNFGNGSNNNVFQYSDANGQTFNRNVDVSLDVITLDEQSGTLANPDIPEFTVKSPPAAPPTNLVARLPGGRVIGV